MQLAAKPARVGAGPEQEDAPARFEECKARDDWYPLLALEASNHNRETHQLMNEPKTYLVIPTHRLRDVSETIHEYGEHFWRNGHSPNVRFRGLYSHQCRKVLCPSKLTEDSMRPILCGTKGERGIHSLRELPVAK
jgi:hypothetical protein